MWRTDGRTDGQTDGYAVGYTALAARCKNVGLHRKQQAIGVVTIAQWHYCVIPASLLRHYCITKWHLPKLGTLCLHLCASATVPTLSAGTSRLITSIKPFHSPGYLPPCVSDSAFADIVHLYKFQLLTCLYTYITQTSIAMTCNTWANRAENDVV